MTFWQYPAHPHVFSLGDIGSDFWFTFTLAGGRRVHEMSKSGDQPSAKGREIPRSHM